MGSPIIAARAAVVAATLITFTGLLVGAARATQVEVCGRGLVDLANPPHSERTASQKLLDAVLSELASAADPRSRGVALYVQGSMAAGEAFRSAPGLADCKQSQPCWPMQSSRASAAAEPQIRALEQLSQASVDPVSTALLYVLCSKYQLLEECRTRAAKRWVSIEPTNAAAWLSLASVSEAAEDRDQAMRRIAEGRYFDTHTARVFKLLDAPSARAADPLLGASLQLWMVGHWNVHVIPHGLMLDYCSKESVMDPTRRASCAAMAEMLIATGDSMYPFRFGRSIGERAGWPASRVKALDDEFEAMQFLGSEQSRPERMLTCESVGEWRRYFADVAQHGELEAMRRRLTASGRSVEELAAASREATRRTVAELRKTHPELFEAQRKQR